MDSFAVEATAYRIGGADGNERVFVPRIEQINPGSYTYIQLQGRRWAAAMVRIDLSDWTVVRPGLLSAFMALVTEDGRPLCAGRPVLFSQWPCDVPLHSSHIGTDPDDGVFTVGLRVPSRAWMPQHTALLAEDR